MKPFLGVNVTSDTENTIKDSSEFLTEITPKELSHKLDNATTRMSKALKKAQLHPFWQVIHWLTGFLGVIFGIGIIGSLFTGNFIKGIKNAPWLHITALICIFVWLIITFIGARKEKRVLSAKESVKAKDDALSTFDSILDTLGIPADATEIDILCCRYQVINGVPKMYKNAFHTISSVNLNFRIFRDTQNLYLANPEGKYTFPLKSLRTIRTINEEAAIVDWHKEKSYESEEYEPYGIFNNRLGILCVPGFHALEVEGEKELLWICFPNYEIKIMESITGLIAWGL